MTREEAYEILKTGICLICAYGCKNMDDCDISYCDIRDAVKTVMEEPREDAISRQAVLDMCKKEVDHISKNWQNYHSPSEAKSGFVYIATNIHDLQPVTPRPNMGHWIRIVNRCGTVIALRCSCCEKSPKHATKSDFCPNCGAYMKEVENDT